MVHRTRLTSIKQWTLQTKHNSKCTLTRDITATACDKDTARERTTDSHTPRTRLKEKTTPPTTQDSAAPHTTTIAAGHGLPHASEVHPGGDYW